MNKKVIIVLVILILVLTIASFFIFSGLSLIQEPTTSQEPTASQEPITSKEPITPKNAECKGDNMDDFYSFDTVVNGSDILNSLKSKVTQYIKTINNYIRFSKEDFALSSTIVSDPAKLDPNMYYIKGYRKTSNVLKPGNPPNFKWCEEFPDVVYKPLGIPQTVIGPTGWTVIKNLNRRAPYKLNATGDVTCATTPSGACMWQSNDDAALNIINSPTFNPTTIYTCKGNTEPWCKQALPYLKKYPRQTIADAGYVDGTQGPLKRGFYDILGQGVKNDYCRYTGGHPNIKFSCQLSDGSNVFATVYNNKNITDIISGQTPG